MYMCVHVHMHTCMICTNIFICMYTCAHTVYACICVWHLNAYICIHINVCVYWYVYHTYMCMRGIKTVNINLSLLWSHTWVLVMKVRKYIHKVLGPALVFIHTFFILMFGSFQPQNWVTGFPAWCNTGQALWDMVISVLNNGMEQKLIQVRVLSLRFSNLSLPPLPFLWLNMNERWCHLLNVHRQFLWR